MIFGIGLGILIGLMSALVALVLLRTVNSIDFTKIKAVVAVTTEMLAIPSFWFGGPWITTAMISKLSIAEILNPYVVSLSFTFSALLCYPIYRWVVKVGIELGTEGERRKHAK